MVYAIWYMVYGQVWYFYKIFLNLWKLNLKIIVGDIGIIILSYYEIYELFPIAN